jgi:hypothetical protein
VIVSLLISDGRMPHVFGGTIVVSRFRQMNVAVFVGGSHSRRLTMRRRRFFLPDYGDHIRLALADWSMLGMVRRPPRL